MDGWEGQEAECGRGAWLWLAAEVIGGWEVADGMKEGREGDKNPQGGSPVAGEGREKQLTGGWGRSGGGG